MELRVQLVIKLGSILFLLSSCQSADKKSVGNKQWFNQAAVQLQNENGLMKQEGKPFTGIVYALAPNKKDTLWVTAFDEGREDGEWRTYFSNGQLMEQRFFMEGKKAGTRTAWWPNGTVREIDHFENGEYEGECKQWNANGLLTANMHYHRGYEDGLQQQLYDNGKVKANYLMKDGRRYGLLGTKNCVNVSDSVFKTL